MANNKIIRPLAAADRAAWEPLWQAYQRFYEVVIPPETTNLTWARFLDPDEHMHALGAFDTDGRLVGIVHAVFHRSCWLPEWTCYLQDLYVESDQRGQGTGEALIEAVADLAREPEQRRADRELERSSGQPRPSAALALAREVRVGLLRHPRARRGHVAVGLEQLDKRLPEQPMIVRQQYAGPPHAGVSSRTGTRAWSRVPPEGCESIVSSPPRWSTRSRMLTSPSPLLPWTSLGSNPRP